MPVAPPAAPPAAAPPSAPPASPGRPIPPDISQDLYGAGSEIDELDDGQKSGDQPPKKDKPVPDDKGGDDPGKQPRSDTEHDNAEIDELEVIENPDADPDRKKALEKARQQAEKEKDTDKGKEADKDKEIPTRARDLKIVYEQTKAEKKALEGKVSELTGEIEKLRTSNPDEIKALQERLQKAEARRDELESEIRHVDYQKSEEYQSKYQKPYLDAWERATADLKELTVELEGESPRPATVTDLVELLNLPLGEARKRAHMMFAEAADDVMAYRRTILDLGRKQEAALAESRKSAVERDKTRMAEQKAQQEKLSKAWKQEHERFAQTFPRWAKPVEGDEEGNALLAKGLEEVDTFFAGNGMNAEERTKAHVRIRIKAANHDRMALRLKRASERIKKLQDDLKAYEGAEPPGGKVHRPSGQKPSGSVFDEANSEIDALDEK